jgi:hypothetical protein
MISKLFTTAIVAFSLAATVSAADSMPKSGSIPNQRIPTSTPTLSTAKSRIIATYVASDQPNAPLVTGYNPVYSQVVRCNSHTTCTFVLSAMDQIGQCSAANTWTIAVSVDGSLINSAIQGQEPLAGAAPGYVIGNWQGFVTGVAPGNHTVQLDTYVNDNCTQGQWSVTWNVAKT